MILDATQKKLREADFFLQHLKAEEKRFLRSEPEACDFYLSAFLTAARSAGDVIRKEEGQRYRSWWAMRKPQLSAHDSDLLAFTNDQRVYSVHVLGPEVRSSTVYAPIYELQRELESGGGSLQIFAGGVPGEPNPMPMAERSVLKFTSRDGPSVVEVCEEWLGLLRRLLSEYERDVVA